MKAYNLETIAAIRFILKDYLRSPLVKTGPAQELIEAKSHIGLRRSTVAQIFSSIMEDFVKAGRAVKLHRGCWQMVQFESDIVPEIDQAVPVEAHVPPKRKRKQRAEVIQPVVFDPKLTEFLNPKPCMKHVEVYEKLKKIKDKTRFAEEAIVLCGEAGIPLKRLINYINEQREQRHNETGRCENVQQGELTTVRGKELLCDTQRNEVFSRDWSLDGNFRKRDEGGVLPT